MNTEMSPDVDYQRPENLSPKDFISACVGYYGIRYDSAINDSIAYLPSSFGCRDFGLGQLKIASVD